MARSDDDMILHLAVFTFTDDVSADDVDRLTSELTAMAAQIPELRRYQCGSNLRLRPSAADYGVAALVDDEAGMSAYLDSAENEAEYLDPGGLAPGAVGLSRWRGVGEDDGAAHTDFGITRIDPGGRTATHVHSFEESFHVLEGEVILLTPEAAVHLVAGDYGVLPIGVPHAWRALDGTSAAWADLFTPPARERYGSDTYHVAELAAQEPVRVDTRDPRTRSFGNITAE